MTKQPRAFFPTHPLAYALGLLLLWDWCGSGELLAQVQTNGFQWVKTAGGTLNDSGAAVAVDSFTNVVVVGSYSNTVAFESTTLTNAGSTDIFLAKYSPTGSVVWVKRAGGVQEDGASSVAVDAQANIYAAGFFRAQASFGETSLKSRGTASALDGYLTRWDPTGKLLWAQQLGGPNDDRVFGLATTPSGGCVAVGTFQGTATFGANTVLQGAATLVTEAFVAKYDPDGTLSWAKRFFAQRGFAAYAVAVDSSGGVVVGGEFIGSTLIGTNNLASSGDRDAVVFKLSSSGEVLWANRLGGTDVDSARAIAVDAQGGAYAAGFFAEKLVGPFGTLITQGKKDFFLARFTSDGGLEWLKSGGGTLDDVATSLAINPQGGVYLAGGFVVSMVVDGVTLSSAGNQDAFLARFSSAGNLQWMARGGGAGTAIDIANGVTSTDTGEVFITGDFSGSGTFGTNQVSTSGVANHDLFLARRSTVPPSILQQPTAGVATVGDPFSFSVKAAEPGPFRYQWLFNGITLTNETNATLTLPATTIAQAGFYEVLVFNPEASVRSVAVELKVEVKLVAEARGAGELFWDPQQTSYPLGSTVQLLAVAGTEGFFAGWAGDLSGADNPATLLLDDTKHVVAIFGSRLLSLDIVGFGSITPSPDKPLYDPGHQLSLLAEPADFFRFVGWSDGNLSNPRQVTIGITNSYVAIFTNTVPVETITENGASRTAPIGTPALRVDGLFQPDGPVIRGDSATLQLFSTMTNAVILYSLDGSEPTRLYADPFTIQSSVQVRAVAYSPDFVSRADMKAIAIQIVPTFLLRATTPGGGLLSVNPVQTRYLSNSLVTLTATGTNGWSFLGWSGDVSGTNAALSLSITQHLWLEAVFGTSLTVSNLGAGKIQAQPGLAQFPYGSTVRLTAMPDAGNAFAAWGESASGSVNPLTFSITRPNPTIRGLFVAAGSDWPVVVQVAGSGSVVVFPRLNTYSNGQTVVAIATPDARQQFLGWSGDLVSASNRLSLVITQATRIQADFTQAPSLVITQGFSTNLVPGGLRLWVNTPLGSEATVDRSPDWMAWTPWSRVTNLLGRILLRDPDFGSGRSGYYRAHP